MTELSNTEVVHSNTLGLAHRAYFADGFCRCVHSRTWCSKHTCTDLVLINCTDSSRCQIYITSTEHRHKMMEKSHRVLLSPLTQHMIQLGGIAIDHKICDSHFEGHWFESRLDWQGTEGRGRRKE
jgi:hypothetical protein